MHSMLHKKAHHAKAGSPAAILMRGCHAEGGEATANPSNHYSEGGVPMASPMNQYKAGGHPRHKKRDMGGAVDDGASSYKKGGDAKFRFASASPKKKMAIGGAGKERKGFPMT